MSVLSGNRIIYKSIQLLIAAIWLVNGLFCKVIGLVPRHRMIVARILGHSNSFTITKAVGVAEIAMAIWVATGFKARMNAVLQIAIIAIMNILEFILAPDLLLWGKANAIFALLLIIIIWYNEFALNIHEVKE